ncbi:N utilization substance protein B [Gottschalkia purinilytica]|uniref:Transcription antitermination protein NusB n=1 Tax=Gottschalkia purinilytica TaxID=1503 RepID=A0A0L0W7G3_GOTPU|nr:transcription antitermination factor NusB [Gottschalkia purinilytica]KNF07402.1 N utilization substance protein B [Gottschalkia purinilytica]
MGRKIARESAMKLLFQMEMNKEFSQEAMNTFYEVNDFKEDEKNYIQNTVTGIVKNIEKLDDLVEKFSQGWKSNRIAKVDLSILRIAMYEIMFIEDIPVEVSINEAIDIAKKYSTNESSKFINGVLGGFVRNWDDKSE